MLMSNLSMGAAQFRPILGALLTGVDATNSSWRRCFFLFQLESAGIKPVIRAFLANKFIMIAALNNSALI